MTEPFIDRERELAALEERYASGQAELYILYGRRRVGKTELLRAFCRTKPHLFFVADLGTEASLLAEFTRQLSTLAFGRPDALGPFPGWQSAFEFLVRWAAQQRLVVVLDEFTYLVQVTPAFPSLLQRLWDQQLQSTRLMLVLCGSYVGMMERHVLSYRAPLYGRRTGQWHLQPFGFADARRFFPHLDAVTQVQFYAVVGGIPAYLRQFTADFAQAPRPLLEAIERRILTPGSFLYDEPRFLLLQELGEPGRHFAILEAIATGCTRLNEIAQASGLTVQSVPFYLSTLRELGLLERAVPATEPHPEKSKRGIYRLRDHFFRFWFRFVYPHRSLLEQGETARVRALVAQQLDQFTGPAFEELCREYVWQMYRAGTLGFAPRAVGSWWNSHEEIDVVAVGDDELLLGECKWSVAPVGSGVLDELVRKAQALTARGRWRRVHYALFARAGFTPALQARATAEGVQLIDLAQLCP